MSYRYPGRCRLGDVTKAPFSTCGTVQANSLYEPLPSHGCSRFLRKHIDKSGLFTLHQHATRHRRDSCTSK